MSEPSFDKRTATNKELEDNGSQFLGRLSNLKTLDILSLFSAEDLKHKCVEEGRYWLRSKKLAGQLLPHIKSEIKSLAEDQALIVDFQNISTDNDFLFGLVQSLFFPVALDGRRLTQRFVEGKRIIIANPDSSTLLGITQSLEPALTSCMVIPDTKAVPWELLYVGHLEKRLEGLLNDLLLKGMTTAQLAKNAIEKAHGANGNVSENALEKLAGKFAGDLKELYDLGLVERNKIKLVGQIHQPYQYTVYHPYRSVIPPYSPPRVRLYQAPRPPRTKDAVLKLGEHSLEEPEPPDAYRRANVFVAQHYSHFITFLDRCILEPQLLSLGFEIASSLMPYWLMSGSFNQGQEVLERLLKHDTSGTNTKSKATLVNHLGILLRRQNQYEAARYRHRESLSICQSIQYSAEAARAYLSLATIAREKTEYPEALEMVQQSIVHATASNEQGTLWRACFTLACVRHLTGDNLQAEIEIDRCIEEERKNEDKAGLAVSLLWKGQIQLAREDLYGAYRSFAESERLATEIDDKPGIAFAMLWLGTMEIKEGNFTLANILLLASLRLFQDQGDLRSIAKILETLASLSTLQEETESGTFLFAAAQRLREQIGAPLGKAAEDEREYFLRGNLIDDFLSITTKTRRAHIWNAGENASLDEVLRYARKEIESYELEIQVRNLTRT